MRHFFILLLKFFISGYSQNLSLNDMISMLNQWIPKSNLQKILINSYNVDEEMKTEIAEEVMDTLRYWNGEEISEGEKASRKKLQLQSLRKLSHC